MKFVTFFKQKPGESVDDWFFEDYAPIVMETATGIRRWRVRRRMDPPSGTPEVLAVRPDRPELPVYDLISEMWFDYRREFDQRHGSGRLQEEIETEADARTAGSASYRVVEHKAWDRRCGSVPTPIHNVGLVAWRPELSEREALFHWEEHEPVARKVHYGAVAYSRNVVAEALTPGAPEIGGIPDLSFEWRDHFVDRYYSSTRGGKMVGEDLGEFVADYQTLYFSDHVVLVG